MFSHTRLLIQASGTQAMKNIKIGYNDIIIGTDCENIILESECKNIIIRNACKYVKIMQGCGEYGYIDIGASSENITIGKLCAVGTSGNL